MSQLATTIEQSKRLLDAGIDPKSADMCYANVEFNPHYLPDIRLSVISYAKCVETYKTVGLITEGIVPAWSLSRLIDLIAETGLPMNYGPMKDSSAVLDHAVNALEYQLRHANH